MRHGGTDMGCNGGLMDNAFKYIEKNGGLCMEADYPYVSGDTAHQHFLCLQKNCKVVTDATPRNYTDVQVDSEAALMSAVSMQPVSIAIEADQKDFQLYKSGDIPLLGLYPTTPPPPLFPSLPSSPLPPPPPPPHIHTNHITENILHFSSSSGVYTAKCGTTLDHGVLVVGYGVWEGDGVTKFWKVKNSWSSKWGMDGYILLEKGIDQIGGQCGMSFTLYLLPPPSPLYCILTLIYCMITHSLY